VARLSSARDRQDPAKKKHNIHEVAEKEGFKVIHLGKVPHNGSLPTPRRRKKKTQTPKRREKDLLAGKGKEGSVNPKKAIPRGIL